jgi:hypothetical protein
MDALGVVGKRRNLLGYPDVTRSRCCSFTSPSPDSLTHTDRLDEVARLLALGFLRLRARRQAEKSHDPNHLRNFGLDFAAEGSLCDTDAHADRERG